MLGQQLTRFVSRREVGAVLRAAAWSLATFALAAAHLQPVAPAQAAGPAAPTGPAAALDWEHKLGGGQIMHSSPTFADVDGDGLQEILIGTTGRTAPGEVFGGQYVVGAYNSTDGTKLWEVPVGGPVNAAITVANLDGQGDLEAVVAVGGDVADLHHNGGVEVYNARTGAFLWRFLSRDDLPGGTGDTYSDGVFATPAVGDLDGDGDMEIAFGSWDRWFYVLDHTGHKLWDFFNADTFWSSPALADLNKDGYLEIITGADISPATPPPHGYLYVFDRNGAVLVRNETSSPVYSSPAIGDIDHDGWLDIVVGSNDGHVYAYGHTGAALPGWPRVLPAGVLVSSPALADIDGNGDLEIFIGCEDHRVYGLNHNGQDLSGWPIGPFGANIWSSPVVADYDADGELEVLFSVVWSVFAYSTSGTQELEINTGYTIVASPAVGDPDNDGKMEIAIGGSKISDDDFGWLYLYETSTAPATQLPWPMFHANARHTGLVPQPPQVAASPSALTFYHRLDDPGDEVASLVLANVGDGSVAWTAQASSGVVTVSPTSGNTERRSTLFVTVDVANYYQSAGTYDLGTITITAPDAAGSPLSVPVQLVIGNFSKVYLPLTRR